MLQNKNSFLISVIIWNIVIISYYINTYVSCILFIIFALFSFMFFSIKEKNIFSASGLFSLVYMASIGISTPRLIGIYEKWEWSIFTWICIVVLYYSFFLGMVFFNRSKENLLDKYISINIFSTLKTRLKFINIDLILVVLTILSLSVFVYLAQVHGFIPLLSNDVHAYTKFGVGSSLVLFCQISVLTPSICLYRLFERKKTSIKIGYITLIIINVSIILMFKSRDMLIGVGTLLIVTLFYQLRGKQIKINKCKIPVIIILFLAIIVIGILFAILTFARNYSDEYINNLYQAHKFPFNDSLISPYVYISSGFYNFNYMVNALTEHSYGLKMLSPFLILFQLDGLQAQIVAMDNYFVLETLNLYTFLGDPFRDFGVFGIAAVGLFLGYVVNLAERLVMRVKNAYSITLLGIAIHHLVLIFFINWLTSFQYLIYTMMLLLLFLYDKEQLSEVKEESKNDTNK